MVRLADKPLVEYWSAVRFPAIVFCVWIIASLIVSLVDFELYWSFFTSPWLGYSLPIVAYGAAGYIMIACRTSAENRHAAWAGALVGVITGVVSALAGIIMMNSTPLIDRTIVESMAAMPADAAVDSATMRSMMVFFSYAGIILTPLISGLFGALFGWIGGLISRKVECCEEKNEGASVSGSVARPSSTKRPKKKSARKKAALHPR